MKRELKRKLKRFWREWGFSKEDVEIIVGASSVALLIPVLYMIMWLIG